MKKYLPMLGAGALSVCLLLGGMFLGVQIRNQPSASVQEASEVVQTAPQYAVGAVGSTAIPGYETIIFEAGQRTQKVALVNPPENSCYFVISIILPDGTEIYKSGFIPPGKEVGSIKLLTVPAVGIYENAVLRYSCWSEKDDGSMLETNGVDTIFTLEVIP